MSTGPCLYIVATPIGNLGDITRRALEVLGEVDVVVAEDTRLTGSLLAKLGLRQRPMVALFKDKERVRSEQIMEQLREGKSIALCSDAGTPAISDPGALLVRLASGEGIPVIPIPGASAVTTLMSVCGFDEGGFWFEGFLPRKGGDRKGRLQWLRRLDGPFVLYEAPHRILDTLGELATLDPEGEVVVGRELTKLHEEIFRGSLTMALEHFSASQVRGEFVLAVRCTAVPDLPAGLPPLESEVARCQALGLSSRDTAALLAPLYGVGKKQVYNLALRGDPGD